MARGYLRRASGPQSSPSRRRYEAATYARQNGKQREKKKAASQLPFQCLPTQLFSDLPLAQFVQRLAVDAQRGRGTRFQTLRSDLHSAAVAIAVFPDVDLGDCLFDLLD